MWSGSIGGARACRACLRPLASDSADADEIVAVGSVVAFVAATHRRHTAAVGAVVRSTLVAGPDLEEELGADVVASYGLQALAVSLGWSACLVPVVAPVLAVTDVDSIPAPASPGRGVLDLKACPTGGNGGCSSYQAAERFATGHATSENSGHRIDPCRVHLRSLLTVLASSFFALPRCFGATSISAGA